MLAILFLPQSVKYITALLIIQHWFFAIKYVLSLITNNITYGFNSLWPSEAIWHWRSWSTLLQVMACCLTAPSHYMKQRWIIISKVQRHSSEGNFTINTSAVNHWNDLEYYLTKISFKSSRGQEDLHFPTGCLHQTKQPPFPDSIFKLINKIGFSFKFRWSLFLRPNMIYGQRGMATFIMTNIYEFWGTYSTYKIYWYERGITLK